MKIPSNCGIPIGSIGVGKIDFFSDLSVGNITIRNNWSSPLETIKGFHIVDLSTGTFLQGNPVKLSELKFKVKTPSKIENDALFPRVTYQTENPDFKITIYSPFTPGNLKDSSLPIIIFEIEGDGIIAISFPNIVGSKPWGRENYKIEGEINGVLMKNSKALQSDPAYGNMFLGCEGCNTYVSYRSWIPDPKREGMTEGLSVFDLDYLENHKDETYYKIPKFAREELAGIVWKKVRGKEKFYLSWYFNGIPHHYPYGHYYENWFDNSIEIAKYAKEKNLTVKLEEGDDWLIQATRNSMYVLTYSWLTKDGRFAIYEDPKISLLMNTIGGMTWDGASFAILEYFPDLVKQMDEYIAKYIVNGEVPHDLGIESIENPIYGASYPYSWNDLGPTWILMIYRDYKLTNDLQFLRRNYPKMKEVIEWLIQKDEDNDGIPDSKGGYDNSYDGTYMYGASSYVSSLFACAVKSFIEASKILGEDHSKYDKILEKARETLLSLWNGKYFISWENKKTGEKKETCLNSQILGEFWCDILGLGNIVGEDKVKKALESIYKLNGSASNYCLVNSVDENGKIDESTDQMKSCWPRINFAIAAHMILKGMKEQGLEIAKKEWNTISKYPWNQPSKINAYDGSQFGLPYYIGSLSVFLVKIAQKTSSPLT
ncbi:hypothetical protein DFR86_04490 [Acidianus sulfidivorans JP7]|uniref:Glycosyl-hydrolase family 116 catalytic region domain-containing protein n=1 Tax=Acidianus sulfidivorans JP7 TaxID=619593 RepID=A0A2U9ILJ5_9CREN|nr:GH116 family glycosyl hydrolase [Acidianus sulfidivorans]AWR96887.1 hypothetical protein DFR86_04490 [Acidianus sulfidivorans JP7]